MSLFPKWKYHASKDALIVYSAKEEKALGKGWGNSPADFDKVDEPAPAPVAFEPVDAPAAEVPVVEVPEIPPEVAP